jgi:tRNA nucleotidyltransferase/poly(A) polymerase
MYNDIGYQINLATTIRVNDETKKLLVKIRSEISYKDGIDRSMEEIILYLIDVYKKYNKTKIKLDNDEDSSDDDIQIAGPSYKK